MKEQFRHRSPLCGRCGIYVITCIPNKKRYVGSSKNIRVRWNEHRSDLRRHLHTNPHLQNAWVKHGEDAFAITVIEECKAKKLIEREIYWIQQLDTFNKLKGFNINEPSETPHVEEWYLQLRSDMQRRFNQSQADTIRKAYFLAGCSSKELADILPCSTSVIHKVIRGLPPYTHTTPGIQGKIGRFTLSQIYSIYVAKERGTPTITELARQYGCSGELIRRVLDRKGPYENIYVFTQPL